MARAFGLCAGAGHRVKATPAIRCTATRTPCSRITRHGGERGPERREQGHPCDALGGTGSCADRDGGCDRGTLLNTSEQSYSKQDVNNAATTEKESGDTDGPFTLAAWACSDNTGAEVIWIGCPNVGQRTGVSVHSRQPHLPAGLRRFAGRGMTAACSSIPRRWKPSYHGGSFAGHDPGLMFVFILPAAVLVAGAVAVLLRRRR